MAKKANQESMLATGTKISLAVMFGALFFVPRTDFLLGYTMHTWVFFAGVAGVCVALTLRVAHYVSRRNAGLKATPSDSDADTNAAPA